MNIPRLKAVLAAIAWRNEGDTPVDFRHPFVPFNPSSTVPNRYIPCAICAQMQWYRLHKGSSS